MRIFYLLLLLLPAQLPAQIDKLVQYDYNIIYDYTFLPDKNDSSKKITELMLLQTGPLYSTYISHKQYLMDSTMRVLEERMKETKSPPVAPRLDRPAIRYRIFKDHAEQQFHLLTNFGVKRAAYQEALPALNWQLQDGESTIAGYHCKKATLSFAGRDYTAWYTPEIAIVDGPYKFYGLPGIILSIHDQQHHHNFTATIIQKKPTAVVLEKWKGIYLQIFPTKAEFNTYAETLKADPALMYQQDFLKVPQEVMDKVVGQVKESIARYNNPIELP